MSNCSDPDHDRHFGGPDLDPTVCKGYQQIMLVFVCLFDLILYFPSTIFQLGRDGLPGLNQY